MTDPRRIVTFEKNGNKPMRSFGACRMIRNPSSASGSADTAS